MILVNRTDFTLIEIANSGKMRNNFTKNKNQSFWIPFKKNKVNVAETTAKKVPTTFKESLRTTLIIGQTFSLIPVNGILSKNTSDIRFEWSSWKCVYTFLSLIGQFFITVMCIFKVAHSEVTLNVTTPIIFYSTTCITMIMFFRIALRWPQLARNISYVEEMDPSFDRRVTYRCNITCGIVLFLALVEHILSLLSAFAGAMVCYPNRNIYEGFVRHFYPWVFNYLPYTPFLGGLTQFLHFQSTFIWNFSDLFVICMSYYLTSRLQHVNKKLLAAQGKYLPEVFWKTTRENYGRATQLVRRVDDVISGIVFISFANNLFFICLQLFNTLEDGIKGTGECNSRVKNLTPMIFMGRYTVTATFGGWFSNRSVVLWYAEDADPSSGNFFAMHIMLTIMGGYEAAAYFLFSLVYLISRSVAVSLIASQVNTASTVPAPVLYDVPSPVYCIEVQRFLDQVHGDKVALSGLQFFSVTRSLLLTVAGTIVTYELVMFQFNSQQDTTIATTGNLTTTVVPG